MSPPRPSLAIAPELLNLVEGCDLTGFGIARFDLPVLAAEFARAGLSFRVGDRAVVDALAVYHRMEPRDLSAAARYYLGRELDCAHSADADAACAPAVLDAEVGRYGLPRTVAELRAAVVEADSGGVFRRGGDGQLVFGFGKYRGRAAARVAVDDPGYLGWMLRQGFLDDAQALVGATLAAVRPED